MNTPKYLIIHHCGGSDENPLLDTSNQTFEVVNEYHRQKWDFKSSLGYYIGYQYFIDKKGKITQGRADTDEGAHTIGYNTQSIGICLAGNFDVTLPTTTQIEALRGILRDKCKQYNIPKENILPHRHFISKTCYGKNLSDEWARNLLDLPTVSTSCISEKNVIIQQEQKISNLQKLINWLINFNK